LERSARIYQQLLERLQAVPGIASVTLVENALVSGITSNSYVTIDGERRNMYLNAVAPEFFETFGMRLVAGRAIGPQDYQQAPRVAVVNEAAARAYFAGSPLGHRMLWNSKEVEVVGVVADAKYDSVKRATEPALFDSYLQRPGSPGAMYVAARLAGPLTSIEPEIRRAVAEVDANLPLSEFKTQVAQIEASIGKERAFAALLMIFGGFALLLAAIGLRGVTAYAVSRRTNEMGIRLAVGAQKGQVLWLILRQVIVLTVIGVVLGIVLASGLTPMVGSMLFGVVASDLLSIAAAAVVMFAVALVAGFLPARRASRVEILSALRHDGT
jgi:predicted permease